MEVEDIEAVLQKVWDLHDKLSDAIHSISRANFLDSIRSNTNRKVKDGVSAAGKAAAAGGGGYVYYKEFSTGGFDSEYSVSASLQEAKSLNAIRAALENLEDQLEFFHTVQVQQRAEREIAIARMEQSRVILAMRLAEHQGKKSKVIEEAEAFLGHIHNATHTVSHGNSHSSSGSHTAGKFAARKNVKRSAVCNLLFSGFDFVKKSMTGIFCNAAMVAVSMLVLVNAQQVGMKDNYDDSGHHRSKEDVTHIRNMTKVFRPEGSAPSAGDGSGSTSLDVLVARG